MVHLGMQMLAPMEGGVVVEGPQHTQGMVGGTQPVPCLVVVMLVVVMGPMEQEGATISRRVGQAGVPPLALTSLRTLVIGLPGQHSGAEIASCAAYRVDYVPRLFSLADQYIGCCSFYSQPYSLAF